MHAMHTPYTSTGLIELGIGAGPFAGPLQAEGQ